MKCRKCGNEHLRFGAEQVGSGKNGEPIIHKYAYCDSCRTKYDIEHVNFNQEPSASVNTQSKNTEIVQAEFSKKKNSGLSIAACLLALFTYTIYIAVILAVIDLIKHDRAKRHVGSWFAIIYGVIYIIVMSANFETGTSIQPESNTQQETVQNVNATNDIETSEVQSTVKEEEESEQTEPPEETEQQEEALFNVTENYKDMSLGEIAQIDDFYITLNYIKRASTTHSALGYADEIDSSHEVIIGFFEFYNYTENIQDVDRNDVTAYADGIEVKAVNSYYLFSEDGVNEYNSYELDSATACILIVNFEVSKNWDSFDLYYKSDCIWSFNTNEIGNEAYDGQKILGTTSEQPKTEEGYTFEFDGLNVKYDGYEFYVYNNIIYGDVQYIIYKYTILNSGDDVYENSLLGYNMRGYCDNYLLDSADYGMDDKISEYINIYDLEKIQAGKSAQVYVAFEINSTDANYSMAFDPGYITNDLAGMIYAVSN